MANAEIKNLVVICTLIFSIVPIALLLYVSLYNKRKKKHIEEKEKLRLANEELIKAQHEIREQTMQTIGTDLHDNIGQILSLTALTLKSIKAEEPNKILNKVDTAVELISRSIQEMRQLGKLLQGDQLVAKGLDEAIKQEITWIKKSGSYTVKHTQTGTVPPRDPKKDLILFRVVQESLNNIIKHAQASKIKLDLNYQRNGLQLCITDNGIGFDLQNVLYLQNGMGLSHIQKRVALIGGEAMISSSVGKGTTITINIPYV